jgi:hypothetical protein
MVKLLISKSTNPSKDLQTFDEEGYAPTHHLFSTCNNKLMFMTLLPLFRRQQLDINLPRYIFFDRDTSWNPVELFFKTRETIFQTPEDYFIFRNVIFEVLEAITWNPFNLLHSVQHSLQIADLRWIPLLHLFLKGKTASQLEAQKNLKFSRTLFRHSASLYREIEQGLFFINNAHYASILKQKEDPLLFAKPIPSYPNVAPSFMVSCE